MERTEWPSKAHLEDLRNQGILSYSSFCTRCVAVLGVLVGATFLKESAFKFVREARALYVMDRLPEKDELLKLVSSLIDAAWPAFIVPVIAAFSMTLLAGLLQTRFSIRGLTVRFEKLNPFQQVRMGGWPWRLFSGLLGALLILGIGISFLWYYSGLVFSLLNADSQQLGTWLTSLFKAAALFIVPLLIAGAVAGWLVSGLLFKHHHRMTRQEVQAEMADGG